MSVTVVLEVATATPPDDWPTLSLVLEKAVHNYAKEYGLLPGQLIPLTEGRAWLSREISSLRVCDLCLASPILPDDDNDEDEAHNEALSDATGHQTASAATDLNVSRIVRDYEFVFYHTNGLRVMNNTSTATTNSAATAPSALPHAQTGAVPLYTTAHTADAGQDEEEGSSGALRLPCCTALALPHATLDGLWESLYYGEDLEASVALKKQLLQYVVTALEFSRCGVDPNIITWNRLLLFHGPPGTGKTSLAKALSQKLALRLQSSTFPRAKLIEVNAHSLFSRWFSESGKQVTQLFEGIRQFAADASCLVCVLLDEVESLAAARQAAMRGNEPSDAIRVVNALLTQIDALQRSRNVLILTTSNLTGAVDPAFADRADLKVFVGPPGYEARRAMLQASVTELVKRGLLVTSDDEETRADELSRCEDGSVREERRKSLREEVILLAHVSQGLNGRTLKKLPFLAYGLCRANGTGSVISAPNCTTAGEGRRTGDRDATQETTAVLQGQEWQPESRTRCPTVRDVPHVQTYVRFLRKAILRALRDMEEDGAAAGGTHVDTTRPPASVKSTGPDSL